MYYSKSPTMALTLVTLVLSTLMALSSANWLFVWGAMELNLLSFIPIMMQTNNNQETEGSVKYFLAQALGSALLLMSSTSLWMPFSLLHNFMPLILTAAIMLKLGSVPCHFWYPSVMASISWISCLILSTWQKLAPLSILAFLLPQKNMNFIMSMAAMNAVVGGVMGMNQTQLRTIMAYSSIGHIGWMMSLAAIFKPSACITYFAIYCMLISPLFMSMSYLNMFSTKHLSKLSSYSSILHMSLMMIFLSLAGLPPLTGFMPKLMTIMLLVQSMKIVMLILIMGSVMNLFFYLNIVITSMTLTSNQKQILPLVNKSSMKLIIPASILSLGLSPLIIM
uniref:NADH-ubiquinone oxidoreductase chain 2 n=1 Tax=Lumbricus rubellus TaxID=35632 RepID=A0A6B9EVA7_LUMRU|nr:NADH dehydrogenase subunit 2 [Lumbricus rubellus]